ncbi:MAG: hypothetical protein JWN67_230 [Actinomycetia bacterium]|nr:hypothetical protein [Actinomycetes bacterium]
MRTAIRAVLLLAAGLLVAGCGSQRTTAAPWNLRGPASGAVLRLEVGVGSSTCDELDGISVREEADEVRVTATVRRTNERDCTADYLTVDRDVQLQAPLGTRRLSGCRPDGPLTVGKVFGGEETESTCFETVRVVGPVGSS